MFDVCTLLQLKYHRNFNRCFILHRLSNALGVQDNPIKSCILLEGFGNS